MTQFKSADRGCQLTPEEFCQLHLFNPVANLCGNDPKKIMADRYALAVSSRLFSPEQLDMIRLGINPFQK